MKTRRNFAERIGATGMMLAAGLGLHLRAQTPAAAAGASPWTFGGSVMQGYDSNALLSTTQPQGDSTTQVALDMGGHWAGPRWAFVADFAPSGSAYAHNPKLDFVSESYNQAWTYALGPHTHLTWTASAERFPERAGAPAAGAIGAIAVSGASQVFALGTVLSEGATQIGLSHQYSQQSTWSASVSGMLQDYSADSALVQSNSPFGLPENSRSRSVASNLGWNHQVGASTAVTMSLGENELWTLGSSQHLRYLNLQAGLSQKVGGNFIVAVSAGPAWNWTLGEPAGVASLPADSYAANASLAAAWGRSQYSVNWQHSTQLGLLPGSFTTNVVGLQWSESWSRAWTTSLSVGQSLNGSALTTAVSTGQDSVYAAASIRVRLAPGWYLETQSSYNDQSFAGAQASSLARLQVSMGIAFQLGGAQ